MDYKHGQIIWRDLTVSDASLLKAFYKDVIGWEFSDHDMGDYNDYNVIISETKEVISGICHKRETNKDIPSVWLNYVYVDSVKEALEKCIKNKGDVIVPLRKMGAADFAVIADPSGAIIALLH
jgi:predicted enzyme related to lactoylglutathione lyase